MCAALNLVSRGSVTRETDTRARARSTEEGTGYPQVGGVRPLEPVEPCCRVWCLILRAVIQRESFFAG